jgi:hypothetical protein
MTRREILLLAGFLTTLSGSPLVAQEPCPARPRLDCRRSQRNNLLVKKAAGAQYRVVWRWSRGSAISPAELGNPAAGTAYAACAYSGLEQSAALAASLSAGPAQWAALHGDGYLYRDRSAGTVKRLSIRAGPQGASRIKMRALGPLTVPSGAALPITIQLTNLDSGLCWESIFWRAQKHGGGEVRATYDAVPRPNVILINTDDQRADTVGYMPTVLGEIAAKGVRFRNAFVSNPICGPSRASLLSGNYNHNDGVLTNGPYPNGGALELMSVADVLPAVSAELEARIVALGGSIP